MQILINFEFKIFNKIRQNLDEKWLQKNILNPKIGI